MSDQIGHMSWVISSSTTPELLRWASRGVFFEGQAADAAEVSKLQRWNVDFEFKCQRHQLSFEASIQVKHSVQACQLFPCNPCRRRIHKIYINHGSNMLCWLVHHFSLVFMWLILQTLMIPWLALRRHQQSDICGFYINDWTYIKWIDIQFGAHTATPLRRWQVTVWSTLIKRSKFSFLQTLPKY